MFILVFCSFVYALFLFLFRKEGQLERKGRRGRSKNIGRLHDHVSFVYTLAMLRQDIERRARRLPQCRRLKHFLRAATFEDAGQVTSVAVVLAKRRTHVAAYKPVQVMALLPENIVGARPGQNNVFYSDLAVPKKVCAHTLFLKILASVVLEHEQKQFTAPFLASAEGVVISMQ